MSKIKIVISVPSQLKWGSWRSTECHPMLQLHWRAPHNHIWLCKSEVCEQLAQIKIKASNAIWIDNWDSKKYLLNPSRFSTLLILLQERVSFLKKSHNYIYIKIDTVRLCERRNPTQVLRKVTQLSHPSCVQQLDVWREQFHVVSFIFHLLSFFTLLQSEQKPFYHKLNIKWEMSWNKLANKTGTKICSPSC